MTMYAGLDIGERTAICAPSSRTTNSRPLAQRPLIRSYECEANGTKQDKRGDHRQTLSSPPTMPHHKTSLGAIQVSTEFFCIKTGEFVRARRARVRAPCIVTGRLEALEARSLRGTWPASRPIAPTMRLRGSWLPQSN
jgi:hypothetical protein